MDLYELWNSDPNTYRRKQAVTLNSVQVCGFALVSIWDEFSGTKCI